VAAWRAIRYVYEDMDIYDEVEGIVNALLLEIIGEANPSSTNPNSPIGLANLVADKMEGVCDNDGVNNHGSKPFTRPSSNGKIAYEDYTNYAAVNPPMVTEEFVSQQFCDSLNINKWQPLTTPTSRDGSGSTTQEYASPHMGNVEPFAMPCPSSFRPQGPPVFGLDTQGRRSFQDQHNELLDISGELGDLGKVITEFWLPTLEFGNPPAHNMFFCANALIHERRSLADSVKLFMAMGNSQFDAGIGAWDAKRYYDSSRPVTALRCMHTGEQVQAWAGPYQGVQTIDGGNWMPYQEIDFVSPPFSEYVSGHSTFAMAGAVILENFFGAKWVGPNSVTINEGESFFEPRRTDPSDPLYIEGVTDRANQGPNTVGYVPANSVTLSWDTWREGAEESGYSRLYAGVHIEDGNEDGLALGEKVGDVVWEKAESLWNGQRPGDCSSDYVFSSPATTLFASVPLLVAFLFSLL